MKAFDLLTNLEKYNYLKNKVEKYESLKAEIRETEGMFRKSQNYFDLGEVVKFTVRDSADNITYSCKCKIIKMTEHSNHLFSRYNLDLIEVIHGDLLFRPCLEDISYVFLSRI